jgi:hypothetical protein
MSLVVSVEERSDSLPAHPFLLFFIFIGLMFIRVSDKESPEKLVFVWVGAKLDRYAVFVG